MVGINAAFSSLNTGQAQYTACFHKDDDSRGSSYYIFGLSSGDILLTSVHEFASPFVVLWIGSGHKASISALHWASDEAPRWAFNRLKGAIVSADTAGELSLWDVKDGRCLLSNPQALDGAIDHVTIDNSQRYILCCGRSHNVSILSASSLNIVKIISLCDGGIHSMGFISETRLLVMTQASELYSYSWAPNANYIETDSQSRLEIPFAKAPQTQTRTTKDSKLAINACFVAFLLNGYCYVAPLFNYTTLLELKPKINNPQPWSMVMFLASDLLLTHNQLMGFSSRMVFAISGGSNVKARHLSTEYTLWSFLRLFRVTETGRIDFATEGALVYFYKSDTHIILFALAKEKGAMIWKKWTGLWDVFEGQAKEAFASITIHCMAFIASTVIRIFSLAGLPFDLTLPVYCPFDSPVSSMAFAYPDYILMGTESGFLYSGMLHRFIKYEHRKEFTDSLKLFSGHTDSITFILFPLVDHANILVSADSSGVIFIWDFMATKILSHLCCHLGPVCEILQAPPPNSGIVFSFASDGTIGVISVESLQCLYIVPPKILPVICLRWKDNSDYLFFEREDGSLDVYLNLEYVKTVYGSDSVPLIELCNHHKNVDLVSKCIMFQSSIDFKKVVNDDKHPNLTKNLCLSLLSLFHHWRMNSDCDDYLIQLGYHENQHIFTSLIGANGHLSLFDYRSSQNVWNVSPYFTSYRLLMLHCLVQELESKIDMHCFRKFYFMDDFELQHFIPFEFPSLHYFAIKWADSCHQIASMAKSLFKAYFRKLSLVDKNDFIYYWRHFLIIELMDTKHVELHDKSVNVTQTHYACLILGIVGIIEPELFNGEFRKDVTQSLFKIAQESNRSRISLTAAEILATGIAAWHSYIEMDLLFEYYLLLNVAKNDEVSLLAKTCIIKIFVNLGPDYLLQFIKYTLSNKSVQIIQSSFKVLSFGIFKLPLLFYPFLSFIIEATIKTLDPNHLEFRMKNLPYSSHFLQDCFSRYAVTSCHTETQKFALAHEKGPIIIYDLKTATRFHLLEGHGVRSNCISFSLDCGFLASYSETECCILLWKLTVGSISSFLHTALKPCRNIHVDPQFYHSKISNLPFPISGDEIDFTRSVDPLDHLSNNPFKDISIIWKSSHTFDLMNHETQMKMEIDLNSIILIHKV